MLSWLPVDGRARVGREPAQVGVVGERPVGALPRLVLRPALADPRVRFFAGASRASLVSETESGNDQTSTSRTVR